MSSAARSELGQADRREADWFRESEGVLRPLFEKRSRLFTQWLNSGNLRERGSLQRQGVVRGDEKNRWFQAKAAEASGGENGGGSASRISRGVGEGLSLYV